MSPAVRSTLALLMLVTLAIASTPEPVRAGAVPVTPETLIPSLDRATLELDVPRAEEDVLRQLEMETGKSVFVRTTYSAKRVSVGNPDVLDVVALTTTEFQLVAKSVGTTNLLIWDQQGRPQAAIDIHVGAPHSRLQSELRRILDSNDISVESAGNGIVLKGSVPDAVAMEQSLAVARAVLSDEGSEAKTIVNLMTVRGQQQVMLEVVIAEMSRTVRREFGTNLNALIESGNQSFEVFGFLQGLTSPGEGVLQVSDMVNLAGNFSGMGSLSNLQVFLDVLDERGLSKILAEPTLVARSGESASFLVGGEVPIPIAQGGAFGSITVQFKDFGVGVGFTPTVLSPERIHLEVRPEVSEPDFSFGTDISGIVVPGFNTRRAATAIELGDGQSFAIAGLLRDDVVELVGQYPWLGQIPLLGALFRSSQFQQRETELVIIVTPRLVKPLGPGQHALPTDHFIEPNAFEFYFLGLLEGRERPEEGDSGGMVGGVGHQVSTQPEENE
ncbi:MAG TPA: type II and III secretion system protein family protein [Myxococcota bacterium]